MKNENQPIPEDSSNQALNQELAQNRHYNNTYRNIWLFIILLLLLSLGLLGYLYSRNRIDEATNTVSSDKVDISDLLRRDEAATTGKLTVNGPADINGDLHVTGNVVVDGTITSSSSSGSGSLFNTSNNLFGSGCTFQVICNSTLLQSGKTFVIQPSSPYVVGGTIRGLPTQAVDLLQLQNASGYSMVNVTANGSIGVNNPAPQYSLDVNGQARFVGHTATGNVSAIDNSSILTPLTGTPIIRVQGTQEVLTSLTPGYNYYTGSSSEYFVNLSESAPTSYFTGGYHAGEIMSGNPRSYYALAGDAGLAIHEGTGDVQIMAGLLGYTFNNSSGHIGGAAGTFGYLNNNSNGLIDTGNGVGGLIVNADNGIITTANGLNAGIVNGFFVGAGGTGSIVTANGVTVGITNKSSGDITTASGIYIQSPVNSGSGDITNAYGVYIADQSGVSTTIGNNIYSAGASSKNVFDGAISIASTTFGTNSKLMINHNPALGWETTDNAATVQINVSGANTALVVQGAAFSSGTLQEWQNFGGTVQSVVNQSGAFGIGTSTITNKLTVTDTTTTDVAKFNGSAATQCTVVTGVGWSCSSDERLKDNILSISDSLDAVMALRGVTYNWRSDENKAEISGFIAQEVEKVLPNLVTDDPGGYKSLNITGIIPYLVEAVKIQNGKIDDVNKQLSDSGIRVDNLSAELKALAARVDKIEANDSVQNAKLQQLEAEIQNLKNAGSSSVAPAPATP